MINIPVDVCFNLVKDNQKRFYSSKKGYTIDY